MNRKQLLVDVLILVVLIASLLYGYWRLTYPKWSVWRMRETQHIASVKPQYVYYFPFIPVNWIATEPSAKKGVSSPLSCGDVSLLRASWTYNWTPWVINCPGLDAVPMIWGEAQMQYALGGISKYAMLFNEPDLAEQANLSPSRAAELAHELFVRYPDRLWISPAPSNRHPEWLAEWWNEYKSMYETTPPIVGAATHCYDTAQNCIAYVRAQVDLTKSLNLRETWVTEFDFPLRDSRTYPQALDEMTMFLDYLESEPMITRYVPFGTHVYYAFPIQDRAPLIDDNNQLTPWGELYRKY